MKALTIWQPWASLIMAGAKPYEFRRWNFAERPGLRSLIGQRVVIHAGARPVKAHEVQWIVDRITVGVSSLDPDITLPLCRRLLDAHKCQGVLELAAGLGTAVIGEPISVTSLFSTPDSDRLDEHMWAWPLTDIEAFDAPVPMRGYQGFWNWPILEDAA